MTVAYRAGTSARVTGGTGTTGHNSPVTITIPGSVVAGDFMWLKYLADSNTGDPGGQGTINTPAGWTALDAQISTSGAISRTFWRVATVGDTGGAVTVTVDYGTTTVGSGARASLTFDAWSGADNTTPISTHNSASDTTSSTAHVMPTVDTTGLGSTLIASAALIREPTASATMTPSAGWNARNTSLATSGTTGGNAEQCVIDHGTQDAAGAGLGGATVTGSQTGNNNHSYTIAIKPATTTLTARPSADVTTAGWTPSVTASPECTLVADNDDTTYVTSSTAPSSLVWEAKLPTLAQAPDTFTNRIAFTGSASSGTVRGDLVQGTTIIATRTDTYASAPPTTPTDLTHTLTAPEKAAITNLSDLRIRCTVTAA